MQSIQQAPFCRHRHRCFNFRESVRSLLFLSKARKFLFKSNNKSLCKFLSYCSCRFLFRCKRIFCIPVGCAVCGNNLHFHFSMSPCCVYNFALLPLLFKHLLINPFTFFFSFAEQLFFFYFLLLQCLYMNKINA